ncbi:MAG: FmdB family transcriptional regulator [Micrococcales bacterium]|nr:FmdB family transcriptional regulator [Micrococcales bacterium]
MPTYAYACKQCDHRFEVVQSFSDDSLTDCPECGGTLRKVFNSVGVVFKGSGFYRTDSRAGKSASTGSTTPPASSSSDSPASSSSGSSGGSESSASSTATPSTSSSSTASG